MSEVEIQCPECGGMLKEWRYHEKLWACNKCSKIYHEREIRERCGI